MAMLARDPRTVPTIARIAQEVGAVPAALYRHVANQDELFDDVLERILAANAFVFDPRRPWEPQLADWMNGLREHLLRYPAILPMTGRLGRTSPAWLDSSSALIEILSHAGLTERAMTLGYLWVLETTVGLVWQETGLSLPDQIASSRASVKQLSAAARERFEPLRPHLSSLRADELFRFNVERTIEAISTLAASSPPQEPASPSRRTRA